MLSFSSRVDYCKSVFSLVRVKNLRPLQSVLNAAALVITRGRKYDHISDVVRDQLYWLPARENWIQAVQFRYKCLHQLAPQYLVKMFKVVLVLPGRRNLRSASRGTLTELRTKTIDIRAAQFCSVRPENLKKTAIELTRSLTVRGTI